MTPERLTEIEQLVAGGIVYLKPATAKDLIAHIRVLEAHDQARLLASKLAEVCDRPSPEPVQ